MSAGRIRSFRLLLRVRKTVCSCTTVSITPESQKDGVLLYNNMPLWSRAKTTTAVIAAVFVQASFFCGATVPISLDWYGYST